jgi:hypothetical protein
VFFEKHFGIHDDPPGLRRTFRGRPGLPLI